MTNKNNNVFTVSDVEKALAVLKSGTAAGFDGIAREHLIYSHPSLVVCLVLLFNVMCYHGSVPNDFGVGITVPLVKDRLGNITDANNYRGISLCPVISKVCSVGHITDCFFLF